MLARNTTSLIQKKNLIVGIILITFLFHGCATPALWKASDPNEYVRISPDEVSEEELNSKGIEYYRDAETGSYYIEKDNLSKLKDYTLRVFATPLTVAVDAALSILVVGAIGVIYILELDVKEEQEERDRCAIDPDCPYDEKGLYRYYTRPPQF